MEKAHRQSQNELRKLHSALKQEQERNNNLERKLQEFHDMGVQREHEAEFDNNALLGAPKRRKAMFNPGKNRLNAV